MSEKQMFHFFLGPVHEFVASARRTRDFQAGSLLLSWLSAVGAMAAMQQADERSLFPQLDSALKQALLHGGKVLASMPNRFSVEMDIDFDAGAVEQAVRQAWFGLAQQVWEKDVLPVLPEAQRAAVESVWQRQVENFWEIYWIVAPENAPFAMDWRKNWRTPRISKEPGAKCSQMTGLQELSAIEGMNGKDNARRKAFWQSMKQHLGSDLQEGEQLSAIALIKRRMYRHFPSLQVEVMPGLKLHGLKIARPVPSTPFLAAYPALEILAERVEQDLELKKLVELLDQQYVRLGGGHGEFDCWPEKGVAKALLVDGQAWFDKTYENPKGYGLKANASLLMEARSLVQQIWKKTGISPQPYYALLSMDGDGLGKQMGDRAKRPFISEGLARFTARVPEIVRQYKGYLIYAGGDDVLALLPVPYALGCARALRSAYMQAFDEVNRKIKGQADPVKTTLSGAVLFAHYDRPLSRMLARVFELMEMVAKDVTGRDALTVEVLKSSGRHLLWTQPWDYALSDEDGRLVVERLAEQWRQDQEASHRFFYRVIDYLDRLAPELRFYRDMSIQQPLHGSDRVGHVNKTIAKVWAVALKQSGVGSALSMKEAKQAVAALVAQCCPVRRDYDGRIRKDVQEVMRPDGALLVKFLMQHGEVS